MSIEQELLNNDYDSSLEEAYRVLEHLFHEAERRLSIEELPLTRVMAESCG